MRKIIYIVILIFAAAAFFYSAPAKKIEISGRLRLVGDARSSEMVVTPEGGADYYIAAEKSEIEKLKPHQGKKVKASGTHTVEEYKYPDARYNHSKNILIIERLEFLN